MKHGGLLMYARADMVIRTKYTLHVCLPDLEFTRIIIKARPADICCWTVYRRPVRTNVNDVMDKLFADITTIQQRKTCYTLIVAGDFNLPDDSDIQYLKAAMQGLGFTIHQTEHTYRSISGHESTLDYIFTALPEQLRPPVAEASVFCLRSAAITTDHYALICQIKAATLSFADKYKYIYKRQKFDITKFDTDIFSRNYHAPPVASSSSEFLSLFVRSISAAAITTCPMKRYMCDPHDVKKLKTLPSPALEACHRRAVLLKARNKSIDNLTELRNLDKFIRQQSRSAVHRTNINLSFLRTLQPKQMWQAVNAKLKSTSGRILSLVTADQSTITDSTAILRHISHKFQQVYADSCVHCSSPIDIAPQYVNTPDTDELLYNSLSFSSMLRYLQKLPNKAGGPHLIDYRLLRASASAIAGDCQRYAYSVLKHGLPASAKTAFITPVSKKDGGVRPLALSDPITKVCVEKPLATTLTAICEKYQILPQHQYGFRSHRSVADNLFKLQKIILTAYSKQAAGVIICFLDVEKAFDQISHSGILSEFRRHHIGGKVYSLTSDYLRSRYAVVNNYGCTGEPFPVFSGTPQGGVPSPVIFNIAVASSHTDVEAEFGYAILSYADDDAMVGVVHNQSDVQQFNVALAALAAQLKGRLNLNLNALKSSMIYVTLNKQITLDPTVLLNGQPLKEELFHTHLGVIFDSRLRFAHHINSKLARRIGHVGYVIHRLTSLPSVCPPGMKNTMQSLRIQLYKSLFLANLGYAMGTWRLKSTVDKRKLERLQKRFFAPYTAAGLSYDTVLRQHQVLPLVARLDFETSLLILNDYLHSRGHFSYTMPDPNGKTQGSQRLRIISLATRSTRFDHLAYVEGVSLTNAFLRSLDCSILIAITFKTISRAALRSALFDWYWSRFDDGCYRSVVT